MASLINCTVSKIMELRNYFFGRSIERVAPKNRRHTRDEPGIPWNTDALFAAYSRIKPSFVGATFCGLLGIRCCIPGTGTRCRSGDRGHTWHWFRRARHRVKRPRLRNISNMGGCWRRMRRDRAKWHIHHRAVNWITIVYCGIQAHKPDKEDTDHKASNPLPSISRSERASLSHREIPNRVGGVRCHATISKLRQPGQNCRNQLLTKI